jgi:hypothetical protein
MRFRWLFAVAVCFALALTGCVSTASRPAASPPIPTPPPVASPTPPPVNQLTITLDGIVYAHGNTKKLVPLSDGHGLLALFQTLTGVMPSGVDVESPFAGYDSGRKSYEWSDVKVILSDSSGANGIAVLAPAVNGVPIRTEEGISVGSKREDVMAAHGWDVYDENSDGIADDVGLGSREVAGTQSLSHPGSVGIEYLLVRMKGDAVEQIQIPANDFSDI